MPKSPTKRRRKPTKAELQLGWTKPKSQRSLGFHATPPSPPEEEETDSPTPWIIKDEESHLLTIAPTGTGKGRSSVIPTCLTWPGSMVVVDPKGEAAFVTAERRRQLGNEVIVIDPFHLTTDEPDTLNPFDLLPHTDMSVEEFGLMFPSLLHPDQDLSSHREPFWDLRADDLIAGTTACILGAMDEDDHHIAKLRST
ncbi:MAG: type IV secretory system conjugative DNA transfer family protein, partial [Verrucomicrobiota bacterium]